MQVNHTVIVDTLGKKCFLMALDRALIPAPKVPYFVGFLLNPPQSVYDILLRMREGDFDIDYEEIRKVVPLTYVLCSTSAMKGQF